MKPILVMGWKYGCRKGEILSIQWDNVDFKNRMIHLVETKNGTDRNLYMSDKVIKMFYDIEKKT
jgi:integrase